eukprot:TRINITY_DN5569_c0_g1_i2.p1 TRINITY_DN5569_c0_g1~~TRINITY_DN5569_c0_g1_i2.p1  ORF type:complete len:498 (+),score=93.12 TRINITY_DN5569_c0_g1_i2:150-1643(+)
MNRHNPQKRKVNDSDAKAKQETPLERNPKHHKRDDRFMNPMVSLLAVPSKKRQNPKSTQQEENGEKQQNEKSLPPRTNPEATQTLQPKVNLKSQIECVQAPAAKLSPPSVSKIETKQTSQASFLPTKVQMDSFRPEKHVLFFAAAEEPPIVTEQLKLWGDRIKKISLFRQSYRHNQDIPRVSDDLSFIKVEIVTTIESCYRQSDGGYAPSKDASLPTVASTLSAIQIMTLLSIPISQQVREGCHRFLRSCCADDGGFGFTCGKNSDTKSTFQGILLLDLLSSTSTSLLSRSTSSWFNRVFSSKKIQALSLEDVHTIFVVNRIHRLEAVDKSFQETILQLINGKESSSGGFGSFASQPGDLKSTFYALSTLYMMDGAKMISTSTRAGCISFITKCFHRNGGFSCGSTHGVMQDSLYALQSLRILESDIKPFAETTLNFVMRCYAYQGFGCDPATLVATLDRSYAALAVSNLLLCALKPQPTTSVSIDLATGQPNALHP